MKKTNILSIALTALALPGLAMAEEEKKEKSKVTTTVETKTIELKDGESISDAISKALKGLKVEPLGGNIDVDVKTSGQIITIGPDGKTTTSKIEGLDELDQSVKKAMEGVEDLQAGISIQVAPPVQMIGVDGKMRTLKEGETISGILNEMLGDLDGLEGGSLVGPAFVKASEENAAMKKELKAIRKEQAEQRKMLEQILKKVGEQ